MKNEKGQKSQVRTSIKIALVAMVVGLVCIGMRVPMQPVSVKSLVYEGETAVQVVPMAANAETGKVKELRIFIRPQLASGENTNR